MPKQVIPCEFARDCLTPDGETCPEYPDPDNCVKYHRTMVAEGEETQEEYETWLKTVKAKERSDEK